MSSQVNHNPDSLMRLVPRVVEIVIRALSPVCGECMLMLVHSNASAFLRLFCGRFV